MGQEEVLRTLKKAKKPLSRTEIAEILECSKDLVTHLLGDLLKSKSIKCMEIDRIEARKLYNCKQRMRIYFV